MDVGYVAGIVDGEGCINFTRSRGNLIPRLLVTNTNTELLYALRDAFGGDVHVRSTPMKPRWKCQGTWRLANRKAIDLIEIILPYLIVKYNQGILVLILDEYKKILANRPNFDEEDHETFDMLEQEMHALNARGIRGGDGTAQKES
jgi:hypothetical protein